MKAKELHDKIKENLVKKRCFAQKWNCLVKLISILQNIWQTFSGDLFLTPIFNLMKHRDTKI